MHFVQVLALTLLLLAAGKTTWASPGGAPSIACEVLAPSHQENQPQTGPLPYRIILGANKIESGQPVEVKIEGIEEGELFRGLIFQARSDPEVPQSVVGSFSVTQEQIKAVECVRENDTVTHTSREDKTTVTFIWQSPIDFQGTVIFS